LPAEELTSPTVTRPTEKAAAPRRRVWWMVAGGAATLVVIAVYGASMLRDSALSITVTNERQVTSGLGLEFEPVLSPDGSKVVYSKGPPYRTHPYVKVLSGGPAARLGEDLPGYQRNPRWDANGDVVVFETNVPGGQKEYRSSSLLGGTSKTLAIPRLPEVRSADGVAVAPDIAWSADGSRIAYDSSGTLYVRATDGGTAQPVADGLVGVHSLTWSPDGRRIALVKGADWWHSNGLLGTSGPGSVWVVDVDAGSRPTLVSTQDHLNVSPAWLSDSRHLLYVSNRDIRRSIYLTDVESRRPESAHRLAGGSNPHSISLSADGKRLAYSQFSFTANIYAYPIPDTGSVALASGERITAGTEAVGAWQQVSPDGEWIAFGSNINGNDDIFKMRKDGSDRVQLTSDPVDEAVSDWSPDGSEIAFFTAPSDTTPFFIGVVSSDGVRRTILFEDVAVAMWSPDGLGLAFFKATDQTPWIASRTGAGGPWGEPVALADVPCRWPDWSADGTTLVCRSEHGMASYSRSGELIWQWTADGFASFAQPRFSDDGSTIYFAAQDLSGAGGIWSISAAGNALRQVITVDEGSLWMDPLSLSVGSDRIYLAVLEYQSDIWVMDLEY
jgi:Tol biopolymer transport system component